MRRALVLVVKTDMPSARDILGPGGPLARALAGYEDRAGQLLMADAVERALAEDRVLVCEAGTGIGKTLAYLLPAVLSGRKVVISTATRALQEQIFDKDLPLVEKTLGVPVDAVLMKGLGNYLCLRRYHELGQSPASLEAGCNRSLGIIERWAARTSTGDAAELAELEEDDPAWQRVCSSSETRLGSSCPHFRECFVTRMRQNADRARIIVINHHLFFADLAVRGPHPGGVLPDYEAVVFDEAHQLEDIATDFFGVHVSSSRIGAMLRDAEQAFAAAGLSDRLLRKGKGADVVKAVRKASDPFFDAVARAFGSRDGKTTLPEDAWSGALRETYFKLDDALLALASYAETEARTEAIELCARRAKQLRDDMAAIVDGATNRVTWVEARSHSVAIGASLVDLAATFKGRLFAQGAPVVLTSATLATSRGFDFVRARLGLDGDDITVDELVVPSPFDYPAHALVYVPRDLPDPSDPAWLDAATGRIAELLDAVPGGAFLLTTSKRVMLALHASLDRTAGRPIFVQGEAPKGVMLDNFRRAGNAILVATMSFWEGVDVPGPALRLIVIDKIPFLVPTDPVVLARSSAIEEQGKSAFSDYQVPSAAITLKQGFGRLIRTRKDSGVVAILDRRIHTRGYGRLLVGSLPPASRTDDLEQVRAFGRRLTEADTGAASPGARSCNG
jgi:ATP-dependent DNA helicase DinG